MPLTMLQGEWHPSYQLMLSLFLSPVIMDSQTRSYVCHKPGHYALAEYIIFLLNSLSSYTRLPFVDALRGREHESQYEAKQRGHLLSGREMGFHQIRELPAGRIPCLIDNVVDTGATAKAAAEALGNAMVLSFAMSDALLQREKHIGFKR